MARSLSSPKMANSSMLAPILSSRYIARIYRADISKRYMGRSRVSTREPGPERPGRSLERWGDGRGLGFGKHDGRFGAKGTSLRAGQDQYARGQPQRPTYSPYAVDAPGQQDRSERGAGHPAEPPGELVDALVAAAEVLGGDVGEVGVGHGSRDDLAERPDGHRPEKGEEIVSRSRQGEAGPEQQEP